jgi:catechol 2,3-dioxygenase
MESDGQIRAAIRYRPRRIGHINLFVTDMPQSMEFYKRICGFGESGRESRVGAGFLSNGNTHHDIGLVEIQKGSALARKGEALLSEDYGKVAGLNHFGWEMETEADLVDAFRRARAADFPIHRITDQGNSFSTYLFDEDGTVHQFYADKFKDWRKLYTGGELDLHSNPPWRPGERPPSRERNYHEKPEIRRDENAPLHPLHVSHAVMMTDEFERARRFYTEIAGLTALDAAPGMDLLYLKGGASMYDIVLGAAGPGRTRGLHHAAFMLDPRDDLDEAVAKLDAMGILIIRRIDNSRKRSLFIRDPDGVLLEFFILHSPEPGAVAAASREDAFYLA